MLHTAYWVELIARDTGALVAQGVFSEERPTLANMRNTRTRVVFKCTSRRSFGRAEKELLRLADQNGHRLENGWTPSPTAWPSRYR